MARFDKKWLFIHVPAGVVVACMLVCGVVQCNDKNVAQEEKKQAENHLVAASKKIEEAAHKVDSLLKVNNDLFATNVRKGDTINILKDSVNTLNGQIRELKADNDSLVVALDECAKSKANKSVKVKRNKPALVNKPKKAPICPQKTVVKNQENGKVVPMCEKPCVQRTCASSKPVLPVSIDIEEVLPCDNQESGVVVVEEAPRGTVITFGEGATNNGNIVVGNNNNVQQTIVQPDTIVRFTTTKNTVVKCRVISKQRQYR